MTRVALMGAAGDTGNLGVTALQYGLVGALFRHDPDLAVTVFDNGWGRDLFEETYHGVRREVRREGIRTSRRLHRPENVRTARALARAGVRVPLTRTIDAADAVLHLSGGDSFCDLYGQRVFDVVTGEMGFVLDRGRPLVLPPQTYGPFADEANRARAAQIVAAAEMAWARDADSFENLRLLLGDDFDEVRHRRGVDVAFDLEALPGTVRHHRLRDWLSDDGPLLGLNVSGLVYNDPSAAARYGLGIDYPAVVDAILHGLLDDPDARVVLIPHVHAPEGAYESDFVACRSAAERLAPELRGRVHVVDDRFGVRQTKWLISQMGWFCGTRMHATIAALSSAVPCATVAYSLKARGVFASCDNASAVADARTLDDREVIEVVLASYDEREAAGRRLAAAVPTVVEQARRQAGEILERVRPVVASMVEGGR